MSFSEDPFKHVSVVYKAGVFGWECNSCGADSRYRRDVARREFWSGETSVKEIADAFWKHIRESHQLTPEDTEDWS